MKGIGTDTKLSGLRPVCYLVDVPYGFQFPGRIQVFVQETVDLQPDLLGHAGVDAVEGMAAFHILEYFVLELLSCCFKGLYEVFDLKDVHIVIVGIGVDQQGCFQLLCIPYRGTFAVFFDIFFSILSNVIIR